MTILRGFCNKYVIYSYRMNLIYICVFCQKTYINLLKLLLTSISVKGNINKETTDILIITSPSFQPLIQKELALIDLPIRYYILDLHTLMEACCCKLKIFQYDNINKYNKILYLDTDVLVNSDINILFNTEISSDKLYALEESYIGHEYSGGIFFDLKVFYKYTPAFSSGVFYFINSLFMKKLFEDTNIHIDKYMREKNEPPGCLEQPFLIYNSFIQDKYDNQFMKKYLENNPTEAKKDIIIYHFPGCPGEYSSKLSKMIAFLSKNT
jgi:lipopolysaccharide biosynthesis glycosyltransferase